MPKGQFHHKTIHENSSANYTARQRGTETAGFMRSMTAYSGLTFSDRLGKKSAETVAAQGKTA
jgi:hypothetical protein